MLTLADVKINGDYDVIEDRAPISTDLYPVDTTWLDEVAGFSYIATDGSGTWERTDQTNDKKIERQLDSMFYRYFNKTGRLFYDMRSCSEVFCDDKCTTDFLINTYNAISGTLTLTGKTITITDKIGAISVYPDDVIHLTDSARNTALYTVVSIVGDVITVAEDLKDETACGGIVTITVDPDFTNLLGEILYYEVYKKGNESTGLKSETIGTYRYERAGKVQGVHEEYAQRLQQYMSLAPGATC